MTNGKDDKSPKGDHHLRLGNSNSIPKLSSMNYMDPQSDTCDMRVVMKKIGQLLTSEKLDRLQLSGGLKTLWTASVLPPITKSSLSELDIKKIINSPKLRHDLNFEPEITFRPNSDGVRGQLKIKQTKEYWEALSVELAIYIARKNRIHSSENNESPPWLEDSKQFRSVPWRLKKLLESLKEILRILIPGLEWSAVDSRLDVDLLMQEFDKGVCDLVSLIEWLGGILLRSCSPMRDDAVLGMVKSVQIAAQNCDPHGLVYGLKNLFGILETMKLDVANHQIRYLRLMMIEDSVHFEQKYFLRKIAADTMHVAQAQNWYATVVRNELHNLDVSGAHLTVFARSIIDMVISNDSTFPTTFTFDVDRLQVLQVQFRKCVFQVICKEAFFQCLSRIGYAASPSIDTCSNLLQRISNMRGPCSTNNTQQNYTSSVALEIVREAYRLRALESLPDEELVEHTQNILLHALRRESIMSQNLEDCLCIDLEDMVDGELEQISALTPLQLLDRYSHSRTPKPLSNTLKEPDDLQFIAQQISHITILHWRIWSPILYLQPRMEIASQKSSFQARAVHPPLSKSYPSLNKLTEDLARIQIGKPERSCELPTAVEQITKTKADIPSEDSQRSLAGGDELASVVGSMCLIQPRKPREKQREGQRQRRCSSPLV